MHLCLLQSTYYCYNYVHISSIVQYIITDLSPNSFLPSCNCIEQECEINTKYNINKFTIKQK